MATITLSQLSRRYGNYTAVDGINLTIRDGEALTLFGPTGCGKSTVLRIIAGLIDPTAGSVAVDGRVISSAHGSVPPERREMGMLFHSIALWPHLTVFDTIAFALRQRGMDAVAIRTRVDRALALTRVTPHASTTPNRLTRADRCRVALARAISVEPRVLLLDDAFGTLDPADRHALATELRTLQKELHLTTIAVSSDSNEAMLMSDRIAALNRGRIEQIDTPGALYMRPATRFAAPLLGRALLLAGNRTSKQISFAGFTVEITRLRDGVGPTGPITACLRPEHLRLLRPAEDAPSGWLTRTGRITQRTFLGTHWDYVFTAETDGTVFEVAAPNTTVFTAGTEAVLALDPARVELVT
jgi:ABC-type Fe3+/spermidine/putrescine transport system ATPase subunit